MSAEEFNFEEAPERELTSKEVASQPPLELQKRLAAMRGATAHAIAATCALMPGELRAVLAEHRIIDLEPFAERRQKAWDAADWDEVEVIDKTLRGMDFPGLPEPKHVIWTDFGAAVTEECYRITPPSE